MMSERFFGLIPAAGAGERMGQLTPKQYLRLLGRPVLYHSVNALLASGRIDTVFVVLAPGDREFRQHDWGEFGGRIAPLYCGGATRHDSVLNGLVAASSTANRRTGCWCTTRRGPVLGSANCSVCWPRSPRTMWAVYSQCRSPTRSSAPTPPGRSRRPNRANNCGRRRRRRCSATACCCML